MTPNEHFLARCGQLAALADGRVRDSPRVGAVLVFDGRIIGEGYHRIAGRAHAEVNCLASVQPEDRHLIPRSTLYVSLEPCCIEGRSGACTDLIRREKIPTVVFGQRDQTPGVNGRSVEIMRSAGITVHEYPECVATLAQNEERGLMAREERPHLTLKFARSTDGFLRPAERAVDYWITNPISRRLVHRWRANTAAIIVGGATVVEDNPALTTRLFPGPDAVPVVLDPRNRVSGRERVFTAGGQKPILCAGSARTDVDAEVFVMGDTLDEGALTRVLSRLMEQRLARVTIEGGAAVLEAFLAAGLWDEARVFTGTSTFGAGLPAPDMSRHELVTTAFVGSDKLERFRPVRY